MSFFNIEFVLDLVHDVVAKQPLPAQRRKGMAFSRDYRIDEVAANSQRVDACHANRTGLRRYPASSTSFLGKTAPTRRRANHRGRHCRITGLKVTLRW
jgi:hypothetical protein